MIAHAQAAAANHQKHIDDLNRAAMIQRLQAANAAAASAAAARPGMPIGMVSLAYMFVCAVRACLYVNACSSGIVVNCGLK